MSNLGVITEQGFILGENLGFQSVNEQELGKKKKDDKNKDNKEKK